MGQEGRGDVELYTRFRPLGGRCLAHEAAFDNPRRPWFCHSVLLLKSMLSLWIPDRNSSCSD